MTLHSKISFLFQKQERVDINVWNCFGRLVGRRKNRTHSVGKTQKRYGVIYFGVQGHTESTIDSFVFHSFCSIRTNYNFNSSRFLACRHESELRVRVLLVRLVVHYLVEESGFDILKSR